MSEDQKNKNPDNDWKKRDIGALWKREGKNQKFLSGKIVVGEFGEEQEIQIVVFKNRYKDKDNQPDFRIYQDKPIQSPNVDSKTPASQSSSSEDDDLPDILQ